MTAPPWQAQVFAALKAARIVQVGYVPDAGHAHLIEAAHADPDMTAVVLTTEEEGIALSAGTFAQAVEKDQDRIFEGWVIVHGDEEPVFAHTVALDEFLDKESFVAILSNHHLLTRAAVKCQCGGQEEKG